MTKSQARTLINSGRLTVGHLKHLLDMAAVEADGRPARLNPSLTRADAHSILSAGVFSTRDETEVIGSQWNTEKIDRLTAVNILVEFGDVDGASLPLDPRS